MEIEYDRLSADELHGTTQADYLVAVDAHLRLIDGGETVFEEPGFPIVELARSLLIWLGSPDRGDFEFDSMSYEEIGAFRIWHVDGRWALGSVFAPGAATAPGGRRAVDECCRRFIAKVETDLRTMGINAAEVFRR
ncbi:MULTISPECIES: DUF7878 domain-containing protein [unclassified Leifsonia]|uniref:DUF7878 domain-containing protein n=1 Tax=unclassified Leifsonia TaxID=2663824 RepID=UPI0006F77859|nr:MULTISPECIES: hypothetical protein [unclassified Leifsonia]KQX07705.1 hypothetical protein ASC59_08215 [Leifsonia sp. Root1293]KRA11987.1 hypothetical protein ASD61_08215 [Leifsonia sp. Root60]